MLSLKKRKRENKTAASVLLVPTFNFVIHGSLVLLEVKRLAVEPKEPSQHLDHRSYGTGLIFQDSSSLDYRSHKISFILIQFRL